jgi:peptidoglycan/LPS O-acetylase OafA/YrhL
VRASHVNEWSFPGVSQVNRLAGVDGLRAIAALWVVLFHIQAFSEARFPWVPGLDLFLRSGSTGVSLFLVLSGFCLYLPFAGGRAHRFKVGQFFWRRCRRLMPAYLVSLLGSLALAVGAASLLGTPPLSFGEAAWQLVTHATLIHTLFPSTFYTLNGAYWSLGLEWQLYLGLPLLVIGVRRFGLARTLSVVIAINVVYRLGLALAIRSHSLPDDPLLNGSVLPNQLPGRWAEFALGMLAAELHVSGRLSIIRARWFALAILLLVPASLLIAGWDLSHLLYGGAFFSLLALVLKDDNVITRVTSWKPLVAVGTMSYSLYLVHQPIVQGLAHVIRTAAPSLSGMAVFGILLALTPLILLLAWVLFTTVEKRTISSGSSTPARTTTPTPVLVSATTTT